MFDHIKNFVFTAACSAVTVDTSYKPPHLLSISKATRKQYAESYYSEGTDFRFPDPKLLLKYLTSIQKRHQKLIKAIEFIISPPSLGFVYEDTRKQWELNQLSYPYPLEDLEARTKETVRNKLQRKNVVVKKETLNIVYHPCEPEDPEWTMRAFIGVARFRIGCSSEDFAANIPLP